MAILSLESKKQRVDNRFAELLKKKYPDKSFREATKQLNSVLEEMLWGKQK